jgi:hypothetical protein
VNPWTEYPFLRRAGIWPLQPRRPRTRKTQDEKTRERNRMVVMKTKQAPVLRGPPSEFSLQLSIIRDFAAPMETETEHDWRRHIRLPFYRALPARASGWLKVRSI